MTRNNLAEQLRWFTRQTRARADSFAPPPTTWSFNTVTKPVPIAGRDCVATESEFDNDLDDTAFSLTRSPPSANRRAPGIAEYLSPRLQSAGNGNGRGQSLETTATRRAQMDQLSMQSIDGHDVGQGGRRTTTSSIPDSDIEVMDVTSPSVHLGDTSASRSSRKRTSDEVNLTSEQDSRRRRADGSKSGSERHSQQDRADDSSRAYEHDILHTREHEPNGIPQQPDHCTYANEIDTPVGPPPPYSTHPAFFSCAGFQEATTSHTIRHNAAVPNEYDDNDDDLFDFNGSRARTVTAHRPSPARRPTAQPRSPTRHHRTQHMSPDRRSPAGPSPVPPRCASDKSPRPQHPRLQADDETNARVAATPNIEATALLPPACSLMGPPSSRPSSKLDTTELDAFFSLSTPAVQEFLHSIEQRRHDISNQAATLIEQDDAAGIDSLFEELDNLKAAANATESLQQRAQKMSRLVQTRDECHSALSRHIREHGGRDVATVKAANAAAKEELESFQVECLALFNACYPHLSDLLKRSRTFAAPVTPKAAYTTQTQMPPARSISPGKATPQPALSIKAKRTEIPLTSYANHHETSSSHRRRTSSASIEMHAEVSGSTRTIGTTHADLAADVSEYGLMDDDDDAELLDLAQADRFQAQPRPIARSTPNRQPLDTISGNARASGSHQKTGKARSALITHDDPESASLFSHPWSNDVKRVLRERFNLQGFRQGQLEAINATLAGEDTFVLMPTGGGKSLCYQLPSQIKSGRTRGVTIVVSPLLSLMEDQVQHLKDLNIQALLINGTSTKEHRTKILQTLRQQNVEAFIHILYVTPEMLSKNTGMVNAIETLHSNRRLARLVIDEAHCVSQWGHDFRPDYKLLGDFRRKFSNVPVMALTATATENVKADTIHNLSISGCKVMTRSFNRPNLYYEVREKGKSKEVQDNIAELIRTRHKGQTGIVYCLSRKNCEDMAEALRKHKVRAEHYHAAMEAKQKSAIQQGWQAGDYQVIVATIAFGMGIDKPNVRFVIHNSLPKSLEGYYQETGRAGRDGEPSRCYLYFGFADVGKLRRMIEENADASYEQKQRQHEMLRRMVQYCTNKADCRRVQVLSYFSEAFDREDCKRTCDNCCSDSRFEITDVTRYANDAVNLVQKLQDSKVTMVYCIDVFRGAAGKKNIRSNGHDKLALFGAGRELERDDVERLFVSLIAQGVLIEDQVINNAGFPVQYAQANPRFRPLTRFELSIRWSPRKSSSKKVSDLPLSTNVSSPIHAQPKSKSRSLKQPRDIASHAYRPGSDAESDAFEPVSVPTARAKATKPITTDDMLDNLDVWHQLAVEDFLIVAKPIVNKLTSQLGLHNVLFSDTILRHMAVDFTTDLDSMKRISGINKAHVDKYGPRLCKLLEKTHTDYKQYLSCAVSDPNAVVIEVSSDEESTAGDAQSDGAYGDVDDEDFEMATQAELDAFNGVFAESQSAAMRRKTVAQPRQKRNVTKAFKKYRGKPARPSSGSKKKRSSSSRHPGLIGMMPT